MATFLIAGDSWSCGEWGHDPYEVKHLGLQYFLEQSGHEVKNISKPGCSNIVSSSLLEDNLKTGSRYDYILWFQTDPLRDLRPYNSFKNIVSIEQMKVINKARMLITYKKLNNLGVKIYCIGGCYKLSDAIQKFENLHVLIPSVIELCLPKFNHTLWFSDWIPFLSKDFLDFDELIEIKKMNDNLGSDKELRHFFYPDGLHANRLAHHLIFKVACDQLKLSSVNIHT